MRDKVHSVGGFDLRGLDLSGVSKETLDNAWRISVVWSIGEWKEWKSLQDWDWEAVQEQWTGLRKLKRRTPKRMLETLLRHHWSRVFLEAGYGWNRKGGNAFKAAADLFDGAFKEGRAFREAFCLIERGLKPEQRYTPPQGCQ